VKLVQFSDGPFKCADCDMRKQARDITDGMSMQSSPVQRCTAVTTDQRPAAIRRPSTRTE